MKKAAALGMLLLVGAVAWATETGRELIFGWWSFAGRVAPRVRMDWPASIVGALAFGLLVCLIDRIGRKWRRPASRATTAYWRFVWTLAIVGSLIVLFAAGISITAIVHQTVWLAGSRQSFFEERVRAGTMEEHAAPLGPAFKAFDDTHRRLPYGGTIGLDGKLLHSWETHLLPYLGHEWALWHKMDFHKEWYSDRNGVICKSIVMDFIRPNSRVSDLRDADGFGLSHFAANSNIMAGNLALKLSDLKDGGSNTILIGEVNKDYFPWGHPANWRDPSNGINQPHGFGGVSTSGGATFVLGDGSVRFISERVSPAVLKSLSTP